MPGSSAAVVFSQQCPVELKQALSNSSAVFEALSIVKTLSVVSNRCCVTLCCLQSSAKELQSCVKTYNKYHLDDEELQQVRPSLWGTQGAAETCRNVAPKSC